MFYSSRFTTQFRGLSEKPRAKDSYANVRYYMLDFETYVFQIGKWNNFGRENRAAIPLFSLQKFRSELEEKRVIHFNSNTLQDLELFYFSVTD